MNSLRHILIVFLVLAASVAYGASNVPGIEVVISERSSGKLAFKGKTDARGRFETGPIGRGAHTVEMRFTKVKQIEGSQLWIGVNGGKGLVTAEAIPGGKLGGAGVAMIVEVGRAAKITGQVVAGTKMVWLPPQLGSNFPGRWVEEDSPDLIPYYNKGRMSLDSVRRIQDKAGQSRL